jgi:hypothetical protein
MSLAANIWIRAASIGALLAAASFSHAARAEESDANKADALFRDAKSRMADKDYEHACPMFADSFKLDPTTGTLLALAICHERQGKLASAWHEYTDAAARSQKEGRDDREKAAREKAAALEPKLSRLTINVSADAHKANGFELTRNGRAVASSDIGKPVVVDGGEQSVEATAPGKQPWKTTVTLRDSEDEKVVNVLPLNDVPAPVAAAAPDDETDTDADEDEETPPTPKPPAKPAAPAEEPPRTDQRRALTALQGAGIATATGGVLALGVGSVFALRAMHKNSDSKSGCYGNLCDADATQTRLDARTDGNAATLGFIAGGVLTAAGAAMYIGGRAASGSGASVNAAAVPLDGARGLGAVVSGRF